MLTSWRCPPGACITQQPRRNQPNPDPGPDFRARQSDLPCLQNCLRCDAVCQLTSLRLFEAVTGAFFTDDPSFETVELRHG